MKYLSEEDEQFVAEDYQGPPGGKPPARVQRLVSRRRRKNRIVMAIAAALLLLVWVLHGWVMLIGVIGLGIFLVCFVAFIEWYHAD